MANLNIGLSSSLVFRGKNWQVDYHESRDGTHVGRVTFIHPNTIPRRKIDYETRVSWKKVGITPTIEVLVTLEVAHASPILNGYIGVAKCRAWTGGIYTGGKSSG